MIPQKYRAYAYRVATAVAAAAVGFGIINDSKAALLLGVVGTLTNGLAAANTSTREFD